MNPIAVRTRDALIDSIQRRWAVVDWDILYPWWRRPAEVRILLYADGSVRFDGGPFLGLKYVSSLLRTRAYSYVKFIVESAHRNGSDSSATIAGAKKLTDLDILANYDEIWFFGSNSAPALDAAEISVLSNFMAAPKFGGILVTGDHANLGRSIAGQIPRAGVMRQYPAPDAIAPGWNTTLEDGPDAGTSFDFEDQSDDRPQTIRWRRYPIASPLAFNRRYRPHPVLCGPDGPIDVLPDHQHEGEALAPVPASGDASWPTNGSHQEAPEVIAWGRIKDPSATRHGQEIGVVSAYNGHNVDVGRVLADSTWHHWFDINLTGVAAPPSPYAGFDETAAGAAALKKIDTYYLNSAVWLAPPGKQADMRHFGWWSILWTDRIIELTPKLPIWYLGEQAIDALGRRASRCTVHEWIFEPIYREKIPRWEWPQWLDRFRLVDPPVERYVAGGILAELMSQFIGEEGKHELPDRAPDDKAIVQALTTGVNRGVKALGEDIHAQGEVLSKLTARIQQ